MCYCQSLGVLYGAVGSTGIIFVFAVLMAFGRSKTL
jgi:hypothetical protein